MQVYLRRPDSARDRPAWVLGGVAKVSVGPDETRTARMAVDPATLRHWDADAADWSVEPGPLELRVARSAGDPGTVLSLEITT